MYFLRNITNLPNWLGYLLATLTWLFWVTDIIAMPSEINLYVSIALCIINGILFLNTCQKGNFIQLLNPIPLFIFYLWFGAFKQWHTNIYIHLAVLIWLLITRLVQDSFRSERAMKPMYIASLLLSIGSFFMPALLALIPVVWIGLVERRAWQTRVLLATLLGMATIAICVGIAGFVGYIDFYEFSDIISGEWFGDLSLIISLLSITVVFLVISLLAYIKENTNQRFLILWAILTFAVTMLLGVYQFDSFASILSLALLASITLQTYCFTSDKTILTGILFLLEIPLAAIIWYFV